jgi:titin
MTPFSWFRRLSRRPAVQQPRFRPIVEALEDRLAPATFTVTTPNDSGPGSLRQAILNANAHPGLDSITFNIGGGGFHFIAPSSPLPAITDAVAIKGATQPGFSGSPVIGLDGLSAGSAANGLILKAGSSSVDALAIIRFGQYGIDVQGGTGDAITRCGIGVIPFGFAFANGAGGVLLANAAHGNHIGGTGAGNIISGNGGDGVELLGPGTTGNLITANLIGTTVGGGGSLGNSLAGVAILGKASGNTVTGNVLSGNSSAGVMILDAGTTGNTVSGNRIGLGSNGALVANGFAGVEIALGASANTIGGTAVTARNVISGNSFDGVLISGVGTAGNSVKNNFIGVGTDGLSNQANGANGVAIEEGASKNTLTGSVMGFQPVADVLIDGAAANVVKSNSIGISSAGANIGSSSGKGIWIKDGSANNLIAGNDIGNNGGGSFSGGVQIDGPGTTGNLIQSNTIGLTAAGAAAHNGYGVLIELGATNNTVGGASKAFRNVISANNQADVAILNAGTSGNVVQSNFLGTNAAGTAAAPTESVDCVAISAPFNQIGGVGAGNVMSGNSSGAGGILIGGTTATGNVVEGNFIGTDATGTAAISNAFGVIIQGGASGNQIGGTVAGAGNLICANTSDGVFLNGAGTSNNVIEGNNVGVGTFGQVLGNGIGVLIAGGASNNLIGGTVPRAGNLIAHSTNQGVVIGSSTSDTTTLGDAVLGNTIFGNGKLGIDLADDGVTANQPAGTTGSGPNNLQNFPVLDLARLTGGDVIIQGTLAGPANTTFRVELFADAALDPSGHGQGEFFLGYVTVTMDPSGNASFVAALPFAGAPGKFISATATAISGSNTSANPLFGNTSEFAGDLTAF